MSLHFQPTEDDLSEESEIDEDITDIITELIRYEVLALIMYSIADSFSLSKLLTEEWIFGVSYLNLVGIVFFSGSP